MKIGDVSRRRRFADAARQRWYAHHRTVRFSRRCLQAEVRPAPPVCPSMAIAVSASSDPRLLGGAGDGTSDGPHHASIEHTWYDVVL